MNHHGNSIQGSTHSPVIRLIPGLMYSSSSSKWFQCELYIDRPTLRYQCGIYYSYTIAYPNHPMRSGGCNITPSNLSQLKKCLPQATTYGSKHIWMYICVPANIWCDNLCNLLSIIEASPGNTRGTTALSMYKTDIHTIS